MITGRNNTNEKKYDKYHIDNASNGVSYHGSIYIMVLNYI